MSDDKSSRDTAPDPSVMLRADQREDARVTASTRGRAGPGLALVNLEAMAARVHPRIAAAIGSVLNLSQSPEGNATAAFVMMFSMISFAKYSNLAPETFRKYVLECLDLAGYGPPDLPAGDRILSYDPRVAAIGNRRPGS